MHLRRPFPSDIFTWGEEGKEHETDIQNIGIGHVCRHRVGCVSGLRGVRRRKRDAHRAGGQQIVLTDMTGREGDAGKGGRARDWHA